MKQNALLSPRAAALERIKALVLDTLPSAESKRAYRQALDDFFRWCGAEAADGFTKAAVNAYRASLEARLMSPSTINQRLCAIRKLAIEGADNGFISGPGFSNFTRKGSKAKRDSNRPVADTRTGRKTDFETERDDHEGQA